MPSTTLNYSAGTGQRFLAAVGKDLNLLDSNGVRRSATAAEGKQWIIDRAFECIDRNERPALEAAALATVSVPATDFT